VYKAYRHHLCRLFGVSTSIRSAGTNRAFAGGELI